MSMQDNSQNNWKILLEEPEHFAGEAIRDKNEAWEKLYLRLHEKPRRKLARWYWVAASVLIVIICGFLLFVNDGKQKDIAVKDRSPLEKEVPAVRESEEGAQPKDSNYTVFTSKERTHRIAVEQRESWVSAIQPVNNNFIPDSINEQVPQLTAAQPLAIETTKTVASTAVPKNKLRVVHINETGHPVEEPTVNNRFSDRNIFGLKILSAEVYDPGNNSSSDNSSILTKRHNTPN
jgi:hypothetical protein